jgi:hypothetical protein
VAEVSEAAHHQRAPRNRQPGRKIGGHGVRIYSDGAGPIDVGLPAGRQVVCDPVVRRGERNNGGMQDVLSDHLVGNHAVGEDRHDRERPDRQRRKESACRGLPSKGGTQGLLGGIGEVDRDARQQFLFSRVGRGFLRVLNDVVHIQRVGDRPRDHVIVSGRIVLPRIYDDSLNRPLFVRNHSAALLKSISRQFGGRRRQIVEPLLKPLKVGCDSIDYFLQGENLRDRHAVRIDFPQLRRGIFQSRVGGNGRNLRRECIVPNENSVHLVQMPFPEANRKAQAVCGPA